jgi:hypothetical protein
LELWMAQHIDWLRRNEKMSKIFLKREYIVHTWSVSTSQSSAAS